LYDEAAVLKAEATMDGARHAGVELSWTTRGRRAHKVVGRRLSIIVDGQVVGGIGPSNGTIASL